MKFYYLHTMELSEAASGDTKLVLESDYNAKLAEKDAEIIRLKEKLLNFEGQTFSENQRIAELEAQNKKLADILYDLIGAIANVDTSNNCTKTQEALGSAETKAEKLLKELEIK